MENVLNTYESAIGYLRSYYETYSKGDLNFGLSLCKRISRECIKIAGEEKLIGIDFGNALLACCFRYAGVTNIMLTKDIGIKLLNDFTQQVNYPEEQVEYIRELINRHSRREIPNGKIERIVWDALGYRLALEDFFKHLHYLHDEMNRIHENSYDELSILLKIRDKFSGEYYYTDYAKKNYSARLIKNKNKVNKRIQHLTENLPDTKNSGTMMTDRETEDLFKIAFRNYVKLVDVADSKAALLIQVNSILISVVIAFVISRIEKYPMLIVPSFLILAVAFITILLSILASRPQRNSYIHDRSSKSYQTFFFGSFDLVGSEFRDADFDSYSLELANLLKSGRENVFNEIFKEVFNVRKVLSRKFTFLSYAYIVFIGGLAASIIAFFIATNYY
ncbi:hypothetical protein EZ456_04745 [Pedobacter psychrodurus]|uniref:Pycsar effector protein domain-containing protein n=1 Tax=Pedobacter psychrodurus TaxID=2530456 RepID=A0A4R0Q749_9SPHI|nr:Pycsar system effector family protein [Pedobacter psychrodurus]TCD28695.1 hypothetical protein EZ456_04745 [Pedobacter psychrodurus]